MECVTSIKLAGNSLSRRRGKKATWPCRRETFTRHRPFPHSGGRYNNRLQSPRTPSKSAQEAAAAMEREWIDRAEAIQKRIVNCKTLFDYDSKRQEVGKIEQQMAQADFWGNQERAQAVVSQLKVAQGDPQAAGRGRQSGRQPGGPGGNGRRRREPGGRSARASRAAGKALGRPGDSRAC